MEEGVRVEFSGDELILALVSLIRGVNPAMLRQGPEGFTVDFQPIENKQELSADEQLLLRLRAALESTVTASAPSLELSVAEARRLADTLARLESLQPWPPDVLEMSRKLRERLSAVK